MSTADIRLSVRLALVALTLLPGCPAEPMPGVDADVPGEDVGAPRDAPTPDGVSPDVAVPTDAPLGADVGASDAGGCDVDGDGFRAEACAGNDCDDGDDLRYPGNPERCAGDLVDGRPAADHDEDCDPCTVSGSAVGDGDEDTDGYVSVGCTNPFLVHAEVASCDPMIVTASVGEPGVVRGNDCVDDPADALAIAIHPDVADLCNGRDDDCDTRTDEEPSVTYYDDCDGDLFGRSGTGVRACAPGQCMGHDAVANDTDCDDTAGARNPGLGEVCDGVLDNDCDGDRGPYDLDDDGFEDAGCGGTDCDDTSASRHPGAAEACDRIDANCDGVTEDGDGDGHYVATATCTGMVPRDDCDDTRPTVHGGATEVCSGRDEDCDGMLDEPPAAASCTIPNASATCAAGGTCTFATCVDGFATCDADLSDGCETPVTTASNCGACGVACGVGGTCEATRTCDPIIALAVGAQHACALRNAGTVVCWGRNALSQLGAPVGTSSSVPVVVPGLTDAVQITAGADHTCALRRTGGVVCWGSNSAGQIGDGVATTTPRATPTAVMGLTGVSEVRAGGSFTCARRADTSVVCWGRDFDGELGDGISGANRFAPGAAVPGVTGAAELEAGVFHACARLAGGAVSCWGRNAEGQIGNDAVAARVGPSAVFGLTNATTISAGRFHTCAIRADASLVCWGLNTAGQLGDASMTQRLRPTAVSGVASVTAVSAGDTHTCAIVAGAGRCWGTGADGRLGNAGTANVSTPAMVTGVPWTPGLVGAGLAFSCVARASPAGVACWGDNTSGQIGSGSASTSFSTAQVVSGF